MKKEDITALKASLLKLMSDERISVAELARRTGRQRQNVWASLRGEQDMKMSFFVEIINAMGYEINIQKKEND